MAPAVALVVRVLLTNSKVGLVRLRNLCRLRCRVAVLPMTRRKWRVEAVDSLKHRWPSLQTVAVGRHGPT